MALASLLNQEGPQVLEHKSDCYKPELPPASALGKRVTARCLTEEAEHRE